MSFELPALPYAPSALAPLISEETLAYHHGKHHRAYVNKLNQMVEGTPYADMSLEDVVCQSEGGLFNNAAQAWNHAFYWQCLSPNTDQTPQGDCLARIEKHFGTYDDFKAAFTQAALTTFGAGWAWLVVDADNNLAIRSTSNAATPITDGEKPLLTCDVWEHAYYVDTRNDRGAYLEHFWRLTNWAFVAEQMSA